MPISGYFDIPFAVGGDLTTVPDPTQISGSVSYESGFPILYSTAVGSGGLDFPRRQHNQILNDITTAIQTQQQGSPAPFITSTMNGGSPYSYPAYAQVSLSGVGYISLVDSNTDTPPSAKWAALSLGQNVYRAGTSTGSANSQILASLSPTTGFSLSNNGTAINFIAGFTNTGGLQLAVTSPAISATNVYKQSGSGPIACTGGEVVVGNPVSVVVAGGIFVLQEASTSLTGFLQASNNLSDVASTSTSLTNLGGLSTSTAAATYATITNLNLKAPLASPAFTGTPTAPTASAGTNNTQLATTAFVQGYNPIMVALGVGAIISAGNNSGSSKAAGATTAASNLQPYTLSYGLSLVTTGDSLAGTWQALQTTATSTIGPWQRTV